MDFWFMIKERYVLLSLFIIFILVSLFLLLATWKKRSDVPKSLTAIITLICTVIIVLSMFALVFSVSFGYNS